MRFFITSIFRSVQNLNLPIFLHWFSAYKNIRFRMSAHKRIQRVQLIIPFSRILIEISAVIGDSSIFIGTQPKGRLVQRMIPLVIPDWLSSILGVVVTEQVFPFNLVHFDAAYNPRLSPGVQDDALVVNNLEPCLVLRNQYTMEGKTIGQIVCKNGVRQGKVSLVIVARR